ncbi:hypothetical protein [Actomonas aquatica]|uniref:Uncharacterized protein n=1 Tax=Actomonas aquatica TaxID=2866162 RepID=A0ABZ1C672_9BACT|nr:hypothetical protein [Opitutus sp. WL0086]WRQ87145.1 hypothetical protein K1X11_020220 [Opitutus sp. WL0086]
MAVPQKFRNLICMADLFFALSASLFLLAAMEGKSLDGEQPIVDRDPDPAAIAEAVNALERETDHVEAQLRALETLVEDLDLKPEETAP